MLAGADEKIQGGAGGQLAAVSFSLLLSFVWLTKERMYQVTPYGSTTVKNEMSPC